MKPIVYSLQFRGQASEIAPGVLRANTAAPSSSLLTKIGSDGLDSRFQSAEGDEARFESEVTFSTTQHSASRGRSTSVTATPSAFAPSAQAGSAPQSIRISSTAP
jgi:hypothetical protein